MKVFIRFLILIAILGILGIVVVGMSLNALVKTGVETMGPNILGVPVTLKDVDISLLSDGKAMRARLNQLMVKNPKGYESESAFFLPTIRILVNRNSVLADIVVIEEILIDNPAITFEGSLLRNNIGDIHENVKRHTQQPSQDGKGEPNSAEQASQDQEAKHVQIKKLLVKGAKINLRLFGGQNEAIPLILPDIEVFDIGKESGGTSFEDASAKIFDAMHLAIIKAVTKSGKLIPKSLEQLGETPEEIGKAAKKLGKKLLEGLLK